MHKQLEQATALEEGDGISIPPPIPIEALLHAHNHEACILSENLVFVVRNRAASKRRGHFYSVKDLSSH